MLIMGAIGLVIVVIIGSKYLNYFYYLISKLKRIKPKIRTLLSVREKRICFLFPGNFM